MSLSKVERDKAYDDIYYTASLIEYIGRKTTNRRSAIVEHIGKKGLEQLVELADVNHCLSFEQVSNEIIDRYAIKEGTYDTVSSCQFEVPSHLAIGRVYARLVSRITESVADYPSMLFQVLTSSITEAISNFNSSFYFAPSDEVEYYYRNRYQNH